MKKTLTILTALTLIGCATQSPKATMRVVSEIKSETQTGIMGDKIVAVTVTRSNSWNRQQWRQGGKPAQIDWPVFSSVVIGAETNVLGNMPAPVVVTNYVTNAVGAATLELLPEEKIAVPRNEVQP